MPFKFRATGGTVLLVLSAFAAALSLPAPARAWGCEGHEVIALLAEKHLTPKALSAVNKILTEYPIDPALSRFCKDGRIDPMSDSSTWADDFRGAHSETSPWHYVDIVPGTTAPSRKDITAAVGKFCDPRASCLPHAVAEQLAILRAPDTDPRKRADALRFVIHFVGDLHQPLHNTTNNDEGGNCVPVAYFGELPRLTFAGSEIYAPTLHGTWDYEILTRATHGMTVDQVAAELDRSYRKKIADWQKEPADFDLWAWESFQLAWTVAYARLPVQIPVETPQPVTSCADADHVSARNFVLNERIEQPYQDAALPVVRERIAQAGARLAMILNQVWP
jgi:S1/P1 Nuclease